MTIKKRKRKVKAKRYSTTTPINAVQETRAQMRAKFPKKLVDAFVKCSDGDWTDEDYEAYKKLATEYLGKEKIKDRMESCKLVVKLASATMDIRKQWETDDKNKKVSKTQTKKKKGKEKASVAKSSKVGSDHSIGPGASKCGPDEGQKEGQEETPPMETKKEQD